MVFNENLGEFSVGIECNKIKFIFEKEKYAVSFVSQVGITVYIISVALIN